MGSFSIWHWLIVLIVIGIIFSPLLIGIAVMGIQRPVLLRHQASGVSRKGFFGYSWTYFFFGWLVPVFRGEIGIGLMHFAFSIITGGVFQVIMPYLYNRQYMTRQLTNGWLLADPDSNRNNEARLRLKIVPVA